MYFPIWATENSRSKVRYLCLILAAEAGPKGLSSLAKKAEVTEATIQTGLTRGNFPLKTAVALTQGNQFGIPFHWLLAPDHIAINDEGFAYDQE